MKEKAEKNKKQTEASKTKNESSSKNIKNLLTRERTHQEF